MVFKSRWVSAVLAGALITAVPVHAEYANDGYDYVNGQWTGWYRAHVSDNVWDEYLNGQHYWRRDFNTNWITVFGNGLSVGAYFTEPYNLYVAYNNQWVPIAQYAAMMQGQQQSGGSVSITIGPGAPLNYENAGANFGNFLDYLATCPTCPPLSSEPWFH